MSSAGLPGQGLGPAASQQASVRVSAHRDAKSVMVSCFFVFFSKMGIGPGS